MRAFRAAVIARRGAPRLDDSSCPQLTGRCVSSRTQARIWISCAGLRTLKVAEIAKAETRGVCATMAARAAASSSSCVGLPIASWPPASCTTASAPSNSTSLLALSWPSS